MQASAASARRPGFAYPRQTAVIVVLVLLGFLVAAFVPHLKTPIRRLVKTRADNGNPVTTAPVDLAALRRVAAIVPSGTTYYLQLPPDAAQLDNDVTGIARLYLLPSLPVSRVQDAHWVVNYHAKPLVPAGTHVQKTYAVGGGVYVVELA